MVAWCQDRLVSHNHGCMASRFNGCNLSTMRPRYRKNPDLTIFLESVSVVAMAEIQLSSTVTDPTRYGYQVLYNYGSTYWRALLGNGAWGLYEVLRSFCHTGGEDTSQFTVKVSITLLQEILGVKDRTVLIGRVKKTKGKTYTYPGWTEVLQTHGLLTAREVIIKKQVQYAFDVLLHPTQLTDEQVSQLPVRLQKKHAQLLDRCQQVSQKREGQIRKLRSESVLFRGVKEQNDPIEISNHKAMEIPIQTRT